MAVQIMMPSSNRFFAILVGFLLLLMPVSYASQFSGAGKTGTETPDGEAYKSAKLGTPEIKGKIVSQLVINVSEDGNITILNSDADSGAGIKEAKGAKEAREAKEITVQDANNECANAQFFAYQTQYAEGTISPAGDNDWWKINLDSGGQLTVQLDGPSNADFDLYVHKSCSTGWICRPYESDADETCAITANTVGYYYLNIDGYSGTGTYFVYADLKSYDLVPGDFTVTPSNPSKQDSITIRYTATNTGPHDITGYFNYKLYIDDIHYGTCNANSGLGAGLTGYCDRTGITLSAGMHVLKNVVDQDNNIAETNEGNNVKTQDQYVTGNYDLVPWDFTVTPSNPSKQDSITVRYRAKNNGPDDITGAFDHRLYIDDVPYQICTTSNGLVAGGVVYCEKTGITLPAGTHVLKNTVDLNNNIAETNEGNNVKTQNQYVTGNYDLLPAEFTVTPANPSQLDSITVRYRAKNNGPDDITSYFNFKLYIDNIHYGTCEANSGLGAGLTGYCDRTGITLTQGAHVLKNVVDQDNNIAETNEGNNVLEQPLPVGCPPDKPYYYDNNCHKCPQDALECSGLCYNKQNSCSFGEPFCGSDGNAYCCAQNYPYACPAGNTCFQKPEYCDGRPIYQCEDKKWVCIDSSAVGTCVGNTLYCCPQNFPYYWTSDGLCHTVPHQEVSCTVPDGSSAQCDCDTNAECPPSHPFCEENYPGYSEGYDACLPSAPEYCGNGACAGNEDYNSCPQDCPAPQGVINVDAVNNNNNKPLSGAYVYLDDSFKGLTDGNGKKSFAAGYGQRNVKVKCPDNAFCAAKAVNVDGVEQVNMGCSCAVQQAGLQVKVRVLNTQTDEGYPIYNAVVFLDEEEKGPTDTFGNYYITNVNYGTHHLGIGLIIADTEGGEPYDHRYSTDVLVDEDFEITTINIALQQQNQAQNPNAITLSAYNSTYAPEVIPILVGAIIWAGFATWSFVEYAKCVEETDSWWGGTGKLLWFGTSCNIAGLAIGNAIDKDHVGDCVKKTTALAKNTWEKCKLELALLGLNSIPGAWITEAVGRVFVVIKGGVHYIPHVEKFLGYGYKVIKESDTFIRLNNGVTEFGYKLIGGGVRIYENVVGMIVKVMDDAGISTKITNTVYHLLTTTHPGDLPPYLNPKNYGNVKGELGERAAVKSADISVGEGLAEGGAVFERPAGQSKELFGKETNWYKLEFNGKGKLEAWKKGTNGWEQLGDLDDFYKVNDRFVVSEVKTMPAANLDNGIPDKWKLWPLPPHIEDGLTTTVIKRLKAVADVTGESPEFILMIPKGEAALSTKLSGFLNGVRSAGFKAEYVEQQATHSAFDEAAHRIVQEAEQGG